MKQHTWRLLDNAILETLEGRDMMSATPLGGVSFGGGVLTLNAAPKHSTDMTVNFYNTNKSQIVARSGSSVEKVAANQVKEIVVNGGTGTENVYINPAIKTPAVVNISTGNAGVRAGTDDTVNAGTGRNAIRLNGGGSTVHLGAGTDVVQASTKGNDVIYAGTGKAIVNGAGSHGSVVGASSKDKLVNTANDKITKAGSPTTGATAPTAASSTTAGTTTAASTTAGATAASTTKAAITPSSATSTPTTTATAAASGTSTSSTSSTAAGTSGSTSPATGSTASTGSTATSTKPVTTAASTSSMTATATATATDATSPQPVISVLAGTHQTGLVVNVSGMQSTLGAGNALGATYAWDFGDSSGAHNTITGFSAGHIYDTPGTYTITLTLTNANNEVAITTQQVTVAASTRNVIYVDANGGSDSNSGSQSQPLQTLAKAVSEMGDNTEILLKAGETYPVGASLNLSSSNVVFGKYDSGADPVLSHTAGNGIGTFNVNPAANGVTFDNITFDSPYASTGVGAAKTGASGVYVGGSNVAIRDCTFLNVDDAVNENGNPTGVLVMDNTAPDPTALRGYFVWGQGSQTTIIGNTVTGSTKEHNIRMFSWNQFTIEDNNLTNSDGKGGIEMQYGSYGYVAGNTTTGGEIRTGPLGEWGEPTTDTTSWVVIKGNTINQTDMDFEPGSQHVLFDNNVINYDNQYQINVHGSDAYTSLDLQIENNTGVSNGTMGGFVTVGGAVDGIVLTNNAWVAPDAIPGGWGTTAVQVNMTSLSDFTSIANNIWPDPTHVYSSAAGINFVNGDYVSDAQWDSYSQVHDDQFTTVTTDDLVGTYQVTAGSITAGSSLALAA